MVIFWIGIAIGVMSGLSALACLFLMIYRSFKSADRDVSNLVYGVVAGFIGVVIGAMVALLGILPLT